MTCISFQDKWWTKPPSLAGEEQSDVQHRLSDPNTYTGMYKKRFDTNDTPSAYPVSGDVVVKPVRAIDLLHSKSRSELSVPTRACDFKNEVEWRMTLRSEEPLYPN